jgi:hypothetical protein
LNTEGTEGTEKRERFKAGMQGFKTARPGFKAEGQLL